MIIRRVIFYLATLFTETYSFIDRLSIENLPLRSEHVDGLNNVGQNSKFVPCLDGLFVTDYIIT